MLGLHTITRGSRIGKEVVELAALVTGVERQVDEAGAQAREIERQRPASACRPVRRRDRLRWQPAATSACANRADAASMSS